MYKIQNAFGLHGKYIYILCYIKSGPRIPRRRVRVINEKRYPGRRALVRKSTTKSSTRKFSAR